MSDTKIKHLNYSGDANFSVRIHFRQNASYQGEIYWVERKQKINFRSLLELILLMQEAMEETGTPHADSSFRTWTEGKKVSSDCR